MPKSVTELNERDIAQALAKWVDEGCPTWATDAAERVSLRVNQGDPGHYADTGPTFTATVT